MSTEEAISLIQYCAQAVGNTYTFGHLTSSIYDTAWVAILRKPGLPGLLFPECYRYILSQQHDGSGWQKSPESEIDGIMCTLGGLFALSKNSDIHIESLSSEDIANRIQHGTSFLNEKLQTWDVASCDHVGFEIIIPCMLEHLSMQGIEFSFPGQALLSELNEKKLAKIHPAVWSGKIQTTITHSLEAFLGKANFSGLKDQRVCGGMGSSPASTAAYLMTCADWDNEAEDYLRQVLRSRWGPEIGGVPGMYPTTGFEVLWIASTLLEDGFDAETLQGIGSVVTMIDEFHESLNGQASGFSKSSVPDADDTSKSIILRNLLGRPTSADKLVQNFEGKTHFLTYMMERHPSVTTNCNALSAILVSPEPENFIPQIEKITKYLCASWKQADIPFQDKWNISEFYPIMLLSQALCRLVNIWDKGALKELSEDLLIDEVALVLFQVVLQILQKQNENGSWGHIPSKEITAYAIIALGNLVSLPFCLQFSDVIRDSIEKGRSFMRSPGVTPDVEFVWIAKTNYSPINISKAYILAALETKYPKYSLGQAFGDLLNLPVKQIQQYTYMFSSLPTLKGFPLWRIEGSVTEAYLFLDKLKNAKLNLFDRQNLKIDEYLEFITMTLTCANNIQGSYLKTDVLFDMMTFILHVYEIDEYFEHVIGRIYGDRLSEIKQFVELFLNFSTARIRESSLSNGSGRKRKLEHTNSTKPDGETQLPLSPQNGYHTPPSDSPTKDTLFAVPLSTIWANLQSYTASITQNASVQRASPADLQIMNIELHRCLLAHITQLQDSADHAAQGADWKSPSGSYHAWVHSIGSAHSCSPLSLAFFRCLLPPDVAGRKVTAEEQYLIQDLWMHLANKARMENDRASVKRDGKEDNLNSVDFAEFGGRRDDGDTKEAIGQLTKIIEYEKRCCGLAFEALEGLVGQKENKQVEGLKFYWLLMEIYNDVYVLKDISSERK